MTTPTAKKKPSFILIAIIAIFALCVICIGGSFAMDALGLIPTSSPTPASTSISAVIQPTAATTQNNRCVPASQQQIETIRTGIKDIEPNNDIQTAWAVKSNDFKNIWFVAAEIFGAGIQPKQAIGVWAISGDPAAPGMTLSVNGFATQFSPYPDGATTDAQTSMNDDGAQQALACATTN